MKLEKCRTLLGKRMPFARTHHPHPVHRSSIPVQGGYIPVQGGYILAQGGYISARAEYTPAPAGAISATRINMSGTEVNTRITRGSVTPQTGNPLAETSGTCCHPEFRLLAASNEKTT